MWSRDIDGTVFNFDKMIDIKVVEYDGQWHTVAWYDGAEARKYVTCEGTEEECLKDQADLFCKLNGELTYEKELARQQKLALMGGVKSGAY